MKKVTVLGAGGMAGHVVSAYLSGTGKYRLQNISHTIKLADDWLTADVERPEDIKAGLAGFRPDIVINCVGLLVKESEQNPGMAAYVNGYFPHFLERLGKETDFKLIHLSTDCVFSGERGSYTEQDARDGKGFYAQSKAMGEVVNGRDLTIRTSIIGPELKKNATGLFHWFFSAKGRVKGFDRAYWNGITTLELAKGIGKLIERGTSGLCHLAPAEKISKYELLKLISEVWNLKETELFPDTEFTSDKTLVSTRPDLDLGIPGYRRQLEELKKWMDGRADLYKHYS